MPQRQPPPSPPSTRLSEAAAARRTTTAAALLMLLALAPVSGAQALERPHTAPDNITSATVVPERVTDQGHLGGCTATAIQADGCEGPLFYEDKVTDVVPTSIKPAAQSASPSASSCKTLSPAALIGGALAAGLSGAAVTGLFLRRAQRAAP